MPWRRIRIFHCGNEQDIHTFPAQLTDDARVVQVAAQDSRQPAVGCIHGLQVHFTSDLSFIP